MNVVKYLIDKNLSDKNLSDKNEIDNYGRTALHLASLFGEYPTAAFLLTVEAANGSSKDNFGMTPIHYAASSGHISLIENLVENGKADLNERDNLKRTVFHFAMWSRTPIDVAHYLLDIAKMDIEVKVR